MVSPDGDGLKTPSIGFADSPLREGAKYNPSAKRTQQFFIFHYSFFIIAYFPPLPDMLSVSKT